MQSSKSYAVRILATGRHLPPKQVTAAELDSRLGLEPGTALKLSGVETRRYADGESMSDMAAAAARDALARAELTLADIDLIVVGNGVPEQLIPSNAALTQQKLGPAAAGIPCFDVGATCMGFLVGLDLVASLISCGRFQRVLLISSETGSKLLNPKQTESAVLFGDAAAAAILGPSDDASDGSRILAVGYETYAEGANTAVLRGGGSALPAHEYTPERRADYLFHMEGPKAYRMAAKILPRLIENTLASASLGFGDIDLWIPHQASALGLELMRRRLNVAPERVMVTLPKYGNTVASSMPLALDEAIREGRLQRGQKACFIVPAAGFSAGVLAIQY
jgi:3-oxoacyl-[acyl-carrier-protein] synthase-3